MKNEKIEMTESQHELALDPKYNSEKCWKFYKESNGANYFVSGLFANKKFKICNNLALSNEPDTK